MKQLNKPKNLSNYDNAVYEAYFSALEYVTKLLSAIEKEELRYSLIRQDALVNKSGILHEFVNPLIYLRLERGIDLKLAIRYGFEPCETYAHITLIFTRFLYKVTMKDANLANIENCIKTEWYVHNPDEMYYYIEEQMKHHVFQLIKFKPSTNKRKQMRVVA